VADDEGDLPAASLTLFHDFTSPASAVAVARLQRLADDGLAVAFAGFEAIGVDVVLPVTIDVLAELDAVAAAADAEGVVLSRPRALPPTGLAHVVGELAEDAGLGASWRDTCYRAFWRESVDLADRAALVDLARDAGLDAPAVADALVDRGCLARVRRRMGAYRNEGVGGVPTILAHRTLVPGLLAEDDLRALAAL
jgi:2-hydroxychromene-2-carboxylate isomerase